MFRQSNGGSIIYNQSPTEGNEKHKKHKETRHSCRVSSHFLASSRSPRVSSRAHVSRVSWFRLFLMCRVRVVCLYCVICRKKNWSSVTHPLALHSPAHARTPNCCRVVVVDPCSTADLDLASRTPAAGLLTVWCRCTRGCR